MYSYPSDILTPSLNDAWFTDPFHNWDNQAHLGTVCPSDLTINFKSNSPDPVSGSWTNVDDSDSDMGGELEPLNMTGEDYIVIGNQAYLKSALSMAGLFDQPFLPAQYTVMDYETPLLFENFTHPLIYDPSDTLTFPSTPPSTSPLVPVTTPTPALVDDHDEDAEGDTEGDASDDDYIPTPLLQARKRLPSSKNASSRTQLPSLHSIPSHSRRRAPAKRSRIAASAQDSPSSSNSELSSYSLSPKKANAWACPHPGCNWVQSNRRTPDLKRHIKKHEPPEWDCLCCRRKFSRRDALKRHIRNKNNNCRLDQFPG